MHIADAIEIVLDLARQSALEPHHLRIDPGLQGEYDRQQEALKLVEDFAVNHLGED